MGPAGCEGLHGCLSSMGRERGLKAMIWVFAFSSLGEKPDWMQRLLLAETEAVSFEARS